MSHPADHAGLVYMLDAAGRTIAGLEERVGQLEQHIAQVTRERDECRRLLDQARATADVPPTGQHRAENEAHDGHPTAPGAPPA